MLSNNSQGYIVNPVSYTDEATGQEVIEDFQVVGNASGEQVRETETHNQADRFVVGEDGEHHYDYSAEEGDYKNLIDGYGGEAVYNEVSEWASANYSPEDVAAYNEIIERGDLNEIADAMELVYQTFNNRNGDEVAPAEEIETDEDIISNYVFSEIIPEADYEKLVAFAQETYDDEFISAYNQVMESNNKEMIKNTIQLLMTKQNEN